MFFFQAEDGIRDLVRSRGLGDVYKRQARFNALDRERNDDNWDLTALLRHTSSASLDIEVGVARKVRSPNLYERYAWSTWPMAATMNNLSLIHISEPTRPY